MTHPKKGTNNILRDQNNQSVQKFLENFTKDHLFKSNWLRKLKKLVLSTYLFSYSFFMLKIYL